MFYGFGKVLLMLHSRFLKIYASLTQLDRKGVKFIWDRACEDAFKELKAC